MYLNVSIRTVYFATTYFPIIYTYNAARDSLVIVNIYIMSINKENF